MRFVLGLNLYRYSMLRSETFLLETGPLATPSNRADNQRYQDLLDAAQSLYYELPYDQVTIERVAHTASLSLGVAQRILGSPEVMLRGVITRGIARLQKAFFYRNPLQTDPESLRTGIQLLLDDVFAVIAQDISFWKLYFFIRKDADLQALLAKELQEFDIFLNLQISSCFRRLQTPSPNDTTARFRNRIRILMQDLLYTHQEDQISRQGKLLVSEFM